MSAGRPAVSVVIPTRDRAALLREAVASALRQSLPPAEVIVVDDGSTEDIPGALREFGDAVRCLRQEGAGQSAARNRGAAAAAGEWIAMLDSDDLWEPEKLERQLTLHRMAPELAWSVTDCLVVDEENRPRKGRQGFGRVFAAAEEYGGPVQGLLATHLRRYVVPVAGGTRVAYGGDAFELLFRGNLALPSSGLVRTDAWREVDGFDATFHSATDTEFFHRLAARRPGGFLLDRLVRYRVHGSQVSVPARSIEKIRNAMRSAEVAARLREPLGPTEQAALAEGRRRLLRRLAWTRLANFEPGEARIALAEYRRAGGRWDAGTLAWQALAHLPAPALGELHRLKRALRGEGRE